MSVAKCKYLDLLIANVSYLENLHQMGPKKWGSSFSSQLKSNNTLSLLKYTPGLGQSILYHIKLCIV